MDREHEEYEGALDAIIKSEIAKVYTMMPGIIQSFDATTQTCSVQPCLKKKFAQEDESRQLPVIEDIPVHFPGSDNFWMTFEPKADSYCWLMFSMRSLARWIEQGGIVDPASSRKYHISDCVALVGINPKPEAISSFDSDAFVIRNADNDTFIKVQDETVTLTSSGGGSVTLDSLGNITANPASGKTFKVGTKFQVTA